MLLDANIDIFAEADVGTTFRISKNVDAVRIHRAWLRGGI